ncbi:MAG: carbohydrate-binding protein [Chthoniobacteraceae bacterium]
MPTVYSLADSLASSFPYQVNKSAFSSRWATTAAKVTELNNVFPSEYTGDLYAGRFENGWVTYNPYETNQTASASIPFHYNTCDHMDLTYSQFTAGVIKEYPGQLTFYLTNYDNVINTGLMTDTITIYGASAEPTWSYVDRASHQASVVTEAWSAGACTLTIQHNGPVDLTVNCSGTATGGITSYTPANIIAPDPPLPCPGPRQYEAECFDYKSIAAVTKNGYSGNLRNYTGQGYLQFGTGSTSSVRDVVTVQNTGTYRLETRYAATGSDTNTIDLYVNGTKVITPTFTATPDLSTWGTFKQNITLNAGSNTIQFKANAANSNPFYFDNIVVVPTSYPTGSIIQENQPGFVSVDGSISTANAGYTGDGYASTNAATGAGINWKINFDTTATKAFTFRYASTTDSVANLLIDGGNVAANVQFPSTGSLTNWDYVTVYASAGSGYSNVRLESVSPTGLPNIDYIQVTGGTALTNVTNLRFDDGSGSTATDSTGHGWNGTLVNSPTWLLGSDAKINGALNFRSGNHSYVTLPSGIVSGLGDFTISFWVNFASVATGMHVFDFSTGTSQNSMYFTPRTSAAVMRFGLCINGNLQVVEAPSNVQFTTGAWTHVAVTLSGNTAFLYLNGQLVGSNTSFTNRPSGLGSTTANYLGKSASSTDPFLDAALDEFQLYDSGFPSDQVALLAAPPAAPLNLVATPGNAKVNLAWTAVSGATNYNIKRSTTSGGPYNILTTVHAPSFTDATVSNGTVYYYVVSDTLGLSESANSFESSATPGSMVACLRFDDAGGTTAIDSTGNGWDGGLVDSPTWVTTGATAMTNGALRLSSSTSDYVTLPAGVVSNLADFTISFWIKLNSNATWARVFDFNSGSTQNSMYFTPRTSGNVMRFAIRLNGNGQNLEAPSSVQLSTGVWTHIAVTKAGNTAALYVNGSSVATLTGMSYTPAALGSTIANYLGKSSSTDPYLDGTLDEFQIFTSALSQASIRSMISQNVLTVPTGLTASAGNNQVILSWNPVAGATSYNLKRGVSSGGPYSVVTGVTGTTQTDTAVSNGTSYYYVVSAVQSVLESANTSQVSARPTVAISAQEVAAPMMTSTSNSLSFTIKSSVVGHTYQLQYCDDLSIGIWQNYGTETSGNGNDLIFAIPTDTSKPQRFYRVMVRP